MAHTHRRVLVPMASAGLLLSLMVFLHTDVLTLRLPRKENRLFNAVRVMPGSEILLRYRHSVEKTPVEGVFSIGPGPVLLARETRMASVGSGLPNTHTARTRRQGNWLVVDEEMATIPGFDFFLSAINRTRLTVEGTKIELASLPSGSVIRIDVERIRLLKWFCWRWYLTTHERIDKNGQSKQPA